ncbi:MAG: NAD(P)-dependent oxidoreductase, partial [Chloroflexota bacterium]
MNVLITGAGLVGCQTARILRDRGHQAVLYDIAPREPYIRSVAGDVAVERGDIRDLAALIDTMQQHHVQAVVHTAFLISGGAADRPYSGMRTNVDGALAVLEATRLSGARRMLFASTQGVYDYDLADRPIPEEHPFSEADHFYVASKVACERLLRGLAASTHLEFAILRFAQIYGRGHYAAGDLAGPAMHYVLDDAL